MIYIRCGNGNTEKYNTKYAEKIQNILDKPQNMKDYEQDYVNFCIKCGWNDPDYGCTSPANEEVYQCPMYIHYHPEEVERFNKATEEWVRSKE